jgi:hypothetical protein
LRLDARERRRSSRQFNRLEASGGYIVGAVLTKATERKGSFGYGYEPYKYGVGKDDHEILMIPHQSDA